MSFQNICPKCQKEMSWNNGTFTCEECAGVYKKVAYCPDCEDEMEKVQACGAVGYYCNTCNEPKSKSRIRFEFQIVE